VAPWTLPAPIGALVACSFDWRAAVLAVFNIFIAAVVYWPFFKAWDKRQLKKEQDDADIDVETTETAVEA